MIARGTNINPLTTLLSKYYCRNLCTCLLLIQILIPACISAEENTNQLQPGKSDASQVSKYIPQGNRVLLIIGQDLESVETYTRSGLFPAPGAVTTYLSFYSLNSRSFPVYGALGMDIDGNAVNTVVDWGAGPLNAMRSVHDYPDAALVIGLSIAEGSANEIWAEGGLASIAVGAYDQQIKHLAKFCKAVKKLIFLRIGYEFDGAWNRRYDHTTSYILAYRHIVDVMRQQGVDNVAYVWQASASPIDEVIDGEHEDITRWYPGDAYVDWMGLSWFLSPDNVKPGVASQRDLADEVVEFARLKQKPLMIAESAPQGYDLTGTTKANISPIWDGIAGGDKYQIASATIWNEWFQPLFDYIRNNRDVIRAFAYINANWEVQRLWASPYRQGYWGDSRIQLNPEIRQRWLDEINDLNFWQHGVSKQITEAVKK